MVLLPIKGGSPAAWTACLGLLIADAAGAAACGPKTMAAADAAKVVSAKFHLAGAMCETDKMPVWRPTPEAVPVKTVAPESQHAEQLSVYDAPDAVPSVSGDDLESTTSVPSNRSVTILVGNAETPMGAAVAGGFASMSRESVRRAIELAPQVKEVADTYRIDPLLLHAIAQVESSHNPQAVSPVGAIGLMQVMPATGRRFGVTQPHSELRNSRTSLEVSSAYLKNLQGRFGNNLELILAAYNAGEGAVEKYGRRIPPYAETQGYVKKVLANYRALLDASRTAPRTTAARQ